MSQDACPVCGEPVEYVEERPIEEDGADATIDVDELCAMDDGVRWNRICPRVTGGDDGDRPTLAIYRHHWDSTGR